MWAWGARNVAMGSPNRVLWVLCVSDGHMGAHVLAIRVDCRFRCAQLVRADPDERSGECENETVEMVPCGSTLELDNDLRHSKCRTHVL